MRRNPLRVLVVDDDADTADTFGLLLRLWGFDVRVCNRGPEALEIADGYGPQVALLDLGLPGMDGYELARRLRGRAGGDTVCLVAVTGYAGDADRRRALAAGCNFHLAKPVDPDELLGLLRALERGHGTDGHRPTEPAPSTRALIADPDESLLRSYQESLASTGFEVVTTTNGLDCLAHLRSWVPDVLVLGDELLWGGDTGVLALMAEDAGVAKAPVVVLLGRPPAGPRPPAAHACLTKPVGVAELAYTIRALVAARGVPATATGVSP